LVDDGLKRDETGNIEGSPAGDFTSTTCTCERIHQRGLEDLTIVKVKLTDESCADEEKNSTTTFGLWTMLSEINFLPFLVIGFLQNIAQ
jgi:hypothetical protein